MKEYVKRAAEIHEMNNDGSFNHVHDFHPQPSVHVDPLLALSFVYYREKKILIIFRAENLCRLLNHV